MYSHLEGTSFISYCIRGGVGGGGGRNQLQVCDIYAIILTETTNLTRREDVWLTSCTMDLLLVVSYSQLVQGTVDTTVRFQAVYMVQRLYLSSGVLGIICCFHCSTEMLFLQSNYTCISSDLRDKNKPSQRQCFTFPPVHCCR